MYQIRKVFTFQGAHALSSAYSEECTKIHGHSYIVEVFLKSKQLNHDGMVVDFKYLKQRTRLIFDEWDHSFATHDKDARFGHVNPILRLPFNPTAENMAKYFYDKIAKDFIMLHKVRVHETATGWAEYYE